MPYQVLAQSLPRRASRLLVKKKNTSIIIIIIIIMPVSESGDGCASGMDGVITESEAVGQRDKPESTVEFQAAEGGDAKKEDMVVKGINTGFEAVVEKLGKLDCFGVEGEERAGGHGSKGKNVASMERSKWLRRRWLLSLMMKVLKWKKMRRRRYFRR